MLLLLWPHLLSCTFSLTWSRVKALLRALSGGPRARVGAGSLCVPSQGGPKPAPGWELAHRGALLGWLMGGERTESGGGPPLAPLGRLTKAFPLETHSFQMLLPKTGQEPLSVTSSQGYLGGRKGRPWGPGLLEKVPTGPPCWAPWGAVSRKPGPEVRGEGTLSALTGQLKGTDVFRHAVCSKAAGTLMNMYSLSNQHYFNK